MSATTGGPSGHPTREIAVVDSDDESTEATTSAAKPTKTKGNRPKRQAPAGKPIPRRGVRKLVYALNKRLGRPNLVPRLSKKEERSRLEDELRFLMSRLQFTVSFANGKGGAAKTTTALYVGSIMSKLTNKVVYVVPATDATATTTTARKAGVRPENTITLSEFAKLSEQFGSYRAVSGKVLPTPAGLRVISEDVHRGISVNEKFTLTKFTSIIGALHDGVDVILLDHGNDDAVESSIVVEAIRRSDVVVFTAAVDEPMSLHALSATIGFYMTDLRSKDNVDLTANTPHRAEKQIATQDKVANSIAVISGIPRKESLEDYSKYTARVDFEGEPLPFGTVGFEGTLMGIPDDLHIKDKKHTVADPRKIKRATYDAYLRLCVAICKKAAELTGVEVLTAPKHRLFPQTVPETAQNGTSQNALSSDASSSGPGTALLTADPQVTS